MENHNCYRNFDSEEVREFGTAANTCYEENGKLFITNGEYSNQVNYCPFCGYKAKIQLKEK